MAKAKKKSGAKVAKKAAKAKVLSPKQVAVREALQVTWLLKGNLKNAQLSYLRVGALLAEVRDKKHFSTLAHTDIETYAAQRLSLGKTSLYKYLGVYDWVRTRHPEWLVPKTKGVIPDLSDAANLIWIENELDKPRLQAARKAALLALQTKALNGTLGQTELNRFRSGATTVQPTVKDFLSKLRALRKRGAALASLPEEVVAHLEAAIEILKNDSTLKLAGMGDIGGFDAERHRFFLA